jgi:hypothetical protein
MAAHRALPLSPRIVRIRIGIGLVLVTAAVLAGLTGFPGDRLPAPDAATTSPQSSVPLDLHPAER